MSDLHQLFNPSSIAILGASRENGKVGNIVIQNIITSGFSGTIYPVNPNASNILDLTCYPNLESLPTRPDLIIVSLPSVLVTENIHKAKNLGYKNFVIFSAGFKEIGPEGKLMEDELVRLATDNNLNILGPNCLGFYNQDSNLNATFGNVKSLAGNLRFISQSGAVVTSLFDYASHHNLGFRDCITLGNKSSLNENHLLSYFLETSKPTDCVGMYLESISFGQEFLALAKKLVQKNIPIFIIKPGRHSTSQKAMLSHTGSLAGEDHIVDISLKEAGVLRVQGFEELFDLSRAFSWLTPPSSNRVAIVSNAGGPAVVSSDLLIDYGLKLATLSPETEKLLQENLPRFAGVHNPVDVLGDAQSDRYKYAINAVLKEDSVDAALVLLTPQSMTDIDNIANVISVISSHFKKPVVASFIGGDVIQSGAKILDTKHIPCYNYPERAIRALSRIYHQSLLNPVFEKQTSRLDQKIDSSVGLLDFIKTQELFLKNNIPVPAYKVIQNKNDLDNFIHENGYPIVLKATGPLLVHKTEKKAVHVNLSSYAQVVSAYSLLLSLQAELKDTQIVSQKHVSSGLEIIFGIKNDPTFGPVAMFGAGGKWVDLLHDRNLMLLPVSPEKAQILIQSSKLSKIIKGFRGESGYPLEKLTVLISNLCTLYQTYSNISELEINPIILTHDTAFAVDGRVIID